MKYETALKADKFLVIAHGSPEKVTKARDMLDASSTADLATYYA